MEKNECKFHGEVKVTVSRIPADATRIEKLSNEKFHIVAPSETTGNHHVIDVTPSIQFYEKDGKTYMKTDEDTQIRCVIAERHDAEILPSGCYEITSQQEYDPFEARLKNVRD